MKSNQFLKFLNFINNNNNNNNNNNENKNKNKKKSNLLRFGIRDFEILFGELEGMVLKA
jgi:hypothetical protein